MLDPYTKKVLEIFNVQVEQHKLAMLKGLMLFHNLTQFIRDM